LSRVSLCDTKWCSLLAVGLNVTISGIQGIILATSPTLSIGSWCSIISNTPASSDHRTENGIVFVVRRNSPVEFKELLFWDLISLFVTIESIVMDFEYLKEINKNFIRDLSSVNNIRMSSSIESLLESFVRSNAAILWIKLFESLFYSHLSLRVHLSQNSIHEFGYRNYTIIVSIKAVEKSLYISILKI
jgi:hypothetical protein